MFPKGQEKILLEWYKIEEEMKEKYMDDMRHVEEIERLEAQEDGHREFIIQSTGWLSINSYLKFDLIFNI